MLKWITVRDFRCFTEAHMELHPGTTVLMGRNAQGKTSLLEAVCILLRLQSPRTTVRTELIRHEANTAVVEGKLRGCQMRHAFTASQRRLALDGAVCARGADYLASSLPVVWMDYSDMNLLRGGAECRRRYLDFTAGQSEPGYLEALRSYDKALRSRNYTLKRDAVVNWRQADAYARVMEEHAHVIQAHRAALLAALLPHAEASLSALSGGSERVEAVFEKGWEGESLFDALAQQRSQEDRTRTSACGPHRDDVRLILNGRDAASFASEGQQRSISLALKLAQARVLESKKGAPPLMLLDDVFGELDARRRTLLMENLPPGSQRIITTTGGDWIQSCPEGQVFEVESAELKPRSN